MIDLLLVVFVKLLLSLRYRVCVRGLRRIARKGRRGILFLPNHPALIDPIILVSRLYGPFGVRALADRDQIDRFLIRRLARRVNVLPIPDMARATSASAEEVRAVLDECVGALQRGDNLILYPAGQTLRSRREAIGGNSAVETILRRLPDVRVVLVRTRGLWGSRFSWAAGREPSVARALLDGAAALLASGVVFAPRRGVSVELVEPDDLPRSAGRAVVNRYLEDFYNADAPPNTYVPYTIWAGGGPRRLPEPAPPRVEGDPAGVPPATRQIVQDYLAELTGQANLADSARLAQDLGLDSLAAAELAGWLQAEFGFAAADVEALRTVGDVMLAACGEAVSAGARTLADVPASWFQRTGRPIRPDRLSEMTIPEAFLLQARRFPDAVALADQASGVRTYRDLVVAVGVLSDRIAQLPGRRVGMMMPASVAANVMYLAALLAGKTPVMVNWTLGARNLLPSLEATGVQRILTAGALLSRLRSQGVDLGAAEQRCVRIEELAGQVSRSAKLRAWAAGRLSWRRLDAAAARAPETAAVLFTSGSESVPKAVPLTHRNILTNVADCYDCFTVSPADSILGILPPFHSFGLTTSMVLPLVLGLRAVYHPNPTDGAALGQMVEAYGATILIGTPTFLAGVVRASGGAQLSSLRLAVSGAEKCPARVYDALARRCRQVTVLEGYGVTECSPVVSVNHQDDPHPGTIGPVMGSLAHAVVDPETLRRVQPGAAGVLLVRGPSVFDGYLNYQGPSPFVEFEGGQWYRTGDLVRQGPGGILTFAGRLKRFIKLGGEMISLPAIEAVLEPHYTTDADEGPVLAVTATPDEEHPEVVLFATKPIDRADANGLIRRAGLSGLHNIRRVVQLDELPLLGTGKADYRALAAKLSDP